MAKISVRDLVGPNAVTYEDGEPVYHALRDALIEGEEVDLDFSGVKVFASPFFNSAIGRLLAEFDSELLNDRIEIAALSSSGESVLRRSIDNAKDYFGDPKQREAVAKVVGDRAAVR